MDLPDWETFLRQTDLLETEMLSKCKVSGNLFKAIVRKSQRQIDQSVSWKVYRRDNYSCRYCGNNQIPLTVDHLVLWENGGPSTENNLVSSCKKCNRTRGNLEYVSWLSHEYYHKVSQKLTEEGRKINNQLIETLDKIKTVIHQKSR